MLQPCELLSSATWKKNLDFVNITIPCNGVCCVMQHNAIDGYDLRQPTPASSDCYSVMSTNVRGRSFVEGPMRFL